MRDFDFYQPRSLTEASAFLKARNGQARILAGGTDLLVRIKKRQIPAPKFMVSLEKIPSLSALVEEKGGLRIGPLVTLQELATSRIIQERFLVLAQAAAAMASPPVRNLATIGGNICNASPAADLAPPLLVLDAGMVCVSNGGERTVPVDSFFLGPGQSCLASDEILASIIVPGLPSFSGTVYLKLGFRRAMAIAALGVAARVSLDVKTGKCAQARVALGAVAPTPFRALAAEERLLETFLEPNDIRDAAVAAARTCQPISDHRASADYRRSMVEVLTRRALHSALSFARAYEENKA